MIKYEFYYDFTTYVIVHEKKKVPICDGERRSLSFNMVCNGKLTNPEAISVIP